MVKPRESDDGAAAGPAAAAAAALSGIEVALLGLLSVRPMTGYEIKHHFDRALAPWWDSPRTQIYPKLRELETQELIEHEYVVQHSKPNKRVYTLTPTGLEWLRGWLGSPVPHSELRHHMMMRLFLGNLLPVEELRWILVDYRDRMAERVRRLREVEAKFSRSLSGPYRDTVFFELLSLRHLIAITDLEVSGTDQTLAALDHADLDQTDLEQGQGDRRPRAEEPAGQLLDIIRDGLQ